MKIFSFGRLFLPAPSPDKTCLAVEDGRVVAVLSESEARSGFVRRSAGYPAAPSSYPEWIDCTSFTAGPGLIDLHCHGGAGFDFADGTPEALSSAAGYHLSRGVTTILATLGSCTTEEMLAVCRSLSEAQKAVPSLFGIHFEGPYFDIDHSGCHLKSLVRNPERGEWEQFLPYQESLKMVTIAPELPGALDFIKEFSRLGTVFSLGHSGASWEDVEKAIDAGLCHSTHIFNAMSRSSRIEFVLTPGVLETSLIRDELSTEIIGDCIHVGPRLAEFVVRVKGITRVSLVSDALRGVGCPPGDYAFGPKNGKVARIIESPRVGILPENPSTLASSAISLGDSLGIYAAQTQLGLSAVWEMASLSPARVLRIEDRKGSLAPGRDADFILLDEALAVKGVYLNGEKRL